MSNILFDRSDSFFPSNSPQIFRWSRRQKTVLPFGITAISILQAGFSLNPANAQFTTVVSGGQTVSGQIVSTGTQTILNLGVASNGILRLTGNQVVSSGGVARGTTISSGGKQYISTGGRADNAIVNSYGSQFVLGGGVATSTTVNVSGYQLVSSGAIANNAQINYSGYQIIYAGGVANNTFVNSGRQTVSSGALVNQTTISGSYGLQTVMSGGSASNTILQSYGSQYLSAGARGDNFNVMGAAYLRVSKGAVATNVSQAVGGRVWADVSRADATTTITGTNNRGTFYLSNGVASNFNIYSSVSQTVFSGGIAQNTLIDHGGLQTIASGGSSFDITQLTNGAINATAYRNDSNTKVTGINTYGQSFYLSNGVASNFVLNQGAGGVPGQGGLTLTSGTVAYNTIINSAGVHTVSHGASSYNVDHRAGGILNLYLSSGDGTYVDGTNIYGSFAITAQYASNFILYDKANHYVSRGGYAISTHVSSGGTQTVYVSGSSIDFIQTIGGNVNNYVVGNDTITHIIGTNTDGIQAELSSGVASNFIFYSSGLQYVSSGGISYDAKLSGGSQYVYNSGTVSGTIISSGGRQYISSGGSAHDTTINLSGYQYVSGYSSGSSAVEAIATDTIINSLGFQYVYVGGVASNTTVNSSGYQYVNGGSATSTTVFLGGRQFVSGGGNPSLTTISSGGSQIVQNAGRPISTTVIDGTQFISFGGSATDNTLIGSGAKQYVYAMGSAISNVLSDGAIQSAIGTYSTSIIYSSVSGSNVSVGVQSYISTAQIQDTIINGATQLVHNLANAVDTEIYDGGKQIVLANSNGSATVTSTSVHDGSQVLSTNANAVSTYVGSAGVQSVSGSGAIADFNTVASGGEQYLISGVATNNLIDGGTQYVYSNGFASVTTVTGGGVQQVQQLASVHKTTLGTDGTQHLDGYAISTNIQGGLQDVMASGSAVSTLISSAGSQYVEGQATSTFIYEGGLQQIASNGSADIITLYSGAMQQIASGGIATNITQSNGGAISVDVYHADTLTKVLGTNISGSFYVSGGSAHNVILYENAVQNVFDSAFASKSYLLGGQQLVHADALVDQTTVGDGGHQFFFSGASALDTNVLSGGSWSVQQAFLFGSTNIHDGAVVSAQYLDLVSNAGLNVEVAGSGVVDWSTEFRGDGVLRKTGSGTLVLSGLNALDDIHYVDGGTLAAGANNALGSNGYILASGTVLDIATTQQTLSSLSGTGTAHIDSGGLLHMQHDNTQTYGGNFDGPGTLDKKGTGTFILDPRQASYNLSVGTVQVSEGILQLGKQDNTNLSLSADDNIHVYNTGILRGAGTLITPEVTVHSGGRIRPGYAESLTRAVSPAIPFGTFTINGDLNLLSGSWTDIRIDPYDTNINDKIVVTGAAHLGGNFQHVYNGSDVFGNTLNGKEWEVLTADGGLTGGYQSVYTDLALLYPYLRYESDKVFLFFSTVEIEPPPLPGDLGPPGGTEEPPPGGPGEQPGPPPDIGPPPDGLPPIVPPIRPPMPPIGIPPDLQPGTSNPFGCDSTNRCNIGFGLGSLGIDNPLIRDIYNNTRKGELQTLLSELSGEIHLGIGAQALTSLQKNSVAHTQRIAAQQMLRTFEPAENNYLWIEPRGDYQSLDGDSNNTHDTRHKGYGLRVGYDYVVNDAEQGLFGGVAVGVMKNNVRIAELHSEADYNSYDLSGNFGMQWPMGEHEKLRVVAHTQILSLKDIDTERAITKAVPQVLESSYNGFGYQLGGEVAYSMLLDAEDTENALVLEPFAGVSYHQLKLDGFQEQGGHAALAGQDRTWKSTDSTIGARVLYNASETTKIQASAAWQHTLDDQQPYGEMRFLSGGTPFHIRGVDTNQDALLLHLGANIEVEKDIELFLNLNSSLGNNGNGHSATIGVNWRF